MPADFEALLSKLEHRKLERLEKDSETYKIMASVFDSSTLLTLYHLINRGVFDVFYGAVSTGKEANIFCALDRQGNYVAVKIYRIATSDFKNMHRYLASDPRFRRVPKERRDVIYTWTSREFKNLQRAHEAGVPVPRPIDCEKNVLAMEFLGEEGVPYPRMKDTPPRSPKRVFKTLFDATKSLYQDAQLIHSDLSEYNVLLTPDPVLIDFSMGTDRKNPMGDKLLMRDLENLVRYFRKLGSKTPDPAELFAKIKES
ncbi:MAG: serine protein kinase RIO [Candidatus Hodarchaeaceae archaeon]|nr:serine protein kinase RIO [Candidatus Hodarchaeaceae archaeon]